MTKRYLDCPLVDMWFSDTHTHYRAENSAFECTVDGITYPRCIQTTDDQIAGISLTKPDTNNR